MLTSKRIDYYYDCAASISSIDEYILLLDILLGSVHYYSGIKYGTI